MKRYGKQLRELRESKGLSQLDTYNRLIASGIETSRSMISRWECDRNSPTIEQFIGLCAIYGVRDVVKVFETGIIDNDLNAAGRKKLDEYRELLVASGMFAPFRPADNVIPIRPRRTAPKYDLGASAGTGVFLDSDSYEMVDVPDEVPPEAAFSLYVRGNSMEPTFEDGQLIWVKIQPTLENGDIGIFTLDGDAYVKEYLETSDGVFLISHNSDYPPIRVTENNDLRIRGKVVYPK